MPNIKQKIAQAIKEGKIVDKATLATFLQNEDLKDKLSEEYPSLKEVLRQIKGEKGEKGDKGDKGERGDDGTNGKNGTNGRDGRDGVDGTSPDVNQIVAEASNRALEGLLPQIPKIGDIVDQMPILSTEIRDALELLKDDERLDASAIKGLEQYTNKADGRPQFGGGSTARNFYQLYDVPQSYAGQGGKVVSVKSDGTGLEFTTASGGSPGGSDTQVQFNDGGTTFGGSSKFTFNKTSGDILLSTGHLRFGGADGTAIVDIAGATSVVQGMRVEGNAAAAISFSTYVTADSFLRFSFLADGTMKWGGGTLVGDTNLYRSSAGVLATDNVFTTIRNALATTSTDGLVLQNTTPALVGTQVQYSPRLRLSGTAWKINATAQSRIADWIIENEPSAGNTQIGSSLVFKYQINGGGYTTAFVADTNATTGTSFKIANGTTYGFLSTSTVLSSTTMSDTSGVQSVNFTSRTLFGSGGTQVLNWQSCYAVDESNQTAIQWGSAYRTLTASSGKKTLDWNNRMLFGVDGSSNEVATVDWQNMYLKNSSAVIVLAWETTTLIDQSTVQSMNWNTREAADSIGFLSINWNDRALRNSVASNSLNWESRILYTNEDGDIRSVDWANRYLVDAGNHEQLKWYVGGMDLGYQSSDLVNFIAGSGASAPSLVGSPPVFSDSYGGGTNALGDPVGWIDIKVGGNAQKIPYY